MIADHRRLAARRPLAAALVAFLTVAGPVAAGEVVDIHYDVEIAGARIMEVNYRLDLEKSGYQSAMSVDSRGILDFFSSMGLDMQGTGRFVGDDLAPVTFQMGSSKSGTDKQVRVSWAPGQAPVAQRSYDLDGDRQQAIAAAVSADMPDPLTALLKAGVLAGATPCSRTERVFNGAEVYDLTFSFDKSDSFGASDGGVYRGPAIKCLVTYRPIAGLSDKKQKKYLEEPPRFNIWFAPVATHSRGTVYVPVAGTGVIKGKRFTALASRATLAGAPLNPQSAANQ